MTPLVNAYDLYQHLMDYWAETMQDDCYLVAGAGWQKGLQPREVVKIKDENGKLKWPKESFDYLKERRRFKSDLLPSAILINQYFVSERNIINELQTKLSDIEQKLQDIIEENSGEEGLLTDVTEGEGDKQKITARSVKVRLNEIGKDPNFLDEFKILQHCTILLEKQTDVKNKLKLSYGDLYTKLDKKYSTLKEEEIKTLVIEEKWLSILSTAVQSELNRVSETLAGRIHQLAERYTISLPTLNEELSKLSLLVNEHLKKMGVI